MKKILLAFAVVSGLFIFNAGKACADPMPNDTVRSTATITIFTVGNTPTAVITNSPAMKRRTTFAVQNISSYSVWCKFNASVAVSSGWLLPPWTSLSIPMVWYSASEGNALTLYCVSEGTSSNLAVLEAF